MSALDPAIIFANFLVPFFLFDLIKLNGNIPSRELTYPTKREKENHLQNAIFGGYVSFPGGYPINTHYTRCLFGA